EILLKMNLPDHRSVLTDPEVTPTRLGRMTKPLEFQILKFFETKYKYYSILRIDVAEAKELFLGEDATKAIPNMGLNLVNVEGVWLSLLGDRGGEFALSTLDVLQRFGFFSMGFTLILATLDGLDVGLLGDVIGEDDCDDDG
ncbi:hypothetical protein Tco_1523850, partial [Tanacetum coccineum]